MSTLEIEIVMAIIAIFLSLFRGALVSEETAINAAEVQGYSEPVVTDHAYFAVGLRGCSTHDAARFTVEAVNPAKKKVTFYVCSGWIFKSATVRVP